MLFHLILTKNIYQLKSGSGPIRSMTMMSNGKIIGGRISGHEIEVYVSSDQGLNWSRIGSVAKNNNVDYGDVMFLSIPKTSVVYCAFREKNIYGYSIIVCRSDNGGKDWVYDSTVIAGSGPFVGAPWLFIANNGDMQCYYDSELLASKNGASGSQWIAMQGRKGLKGEWNHYGIIVASRDINKFKLCRDGMPTVIDLKNNRIMVVTEGVEDKMNGGKYANVVRAIQSFDGGRTWDYNGRRIVYQSWIHSPSKRRYNAYCPMGIRIGNGPVGVVFCTDEDSAELPDDSSANVVNRKCHVKFIRTLDTFEKWGDLKTFWRSGNKAYVPGMIETKFNQVLISIDHFGGRQRFLRYK